MVCSSTHRYLNKGAIVEDRVGVEGHDGHAAVFEQDRSLDGGDAVVVLLRQVGGQHLVVVVVVDDRMDGVAALAASGHAPNTTLDGRVLRRRRGWFRTPTSPAVTAPLLLGGGLRGRRRRLPAALGGRGRRLLVGSLLGAARRPLLLRGRRGWQLLLRVQRVDLGGGGADGGGDRGRLQVEDGREVGGGGAERHAEVDKRHGPAGGCPGLSGAR